MQQDKLVTLAILTYSKALILKDVLEKEGIETLIQNVNQMQPIISSGVRVRIKESDLPHALEITESSAWLAQDVVKGKSPSVNGSYNKVLVPVDFTPYSIKALHMGFRFAEWDHSEVIIMHVSYVPEVNSSILLGDALKLSLRSTAEKNKAIRKQLTEVSRQLDELSAAIKEKVASGEFPDVPFKFILREGIAEDEILDVARQVKPRLIVMGTRSAGNDVHLMGSVTAEVIERSETPVLAVPEHIELDKFSTINHMALITNFDQRDLIAFDALIKNTKQLKFKISFIHLSSNVKNTWNEIKLGGIKQYFSKLYPDLDISYDVIPEDDLLSNLSLYISEHKVDVLSLTSFRRHTITRLFSQSMASKIIFQNRVPLLSLTSMYHKMW